MNNDKIKAYKKDWREGYDGNLQKPIKSSSVFQGGANFDAGLDELLFNRMLQLKNLNSAQTPQGNDPGKLYYEEDTKKYKIWVGAGGWADVIYTSTSTSSTSSSSSSSSTSTTSSSTSSTSTSSTSSSSSSTS